MSWVNPFRKNPTDQSTTSILPVVVDQRLKTQFNIPEPTKSLLWITDEDTSKISSPFSIKLTISVGVEGTNSVVDDGHNFFGEPSLIWKRLPVAKNNELEQEPMYYPSYSSLSPEHRYQYLLWLRDITQPTNLSYVFLYYYGLERHLLVGDFENAAVETLRLIRYHDRGTFRAYAQEALIVATLHRKRVDMFEKYSFILDSATNETLLLRKKIGQNITAKELMDLAPQVGFSNRRYIKLHPTDFERELSTLLAAYEKKNGSLLDLVPHDDMRYEDARVFANSSLPASVRAVKVPQLVTDERFKKKVHEFLTNTHGNLKTGAKEKKIR